MRRHFKYLLGSAALAVAAAVGTTATTTTPANAQVYFDLNFGAPYYYRPYRYYAPYYYYAPICYWDAYYGRVCY